MIAPPLERVLFVTSINPTRHPFVDQQIGLLNRNGIAVRAICRVHVPSGPRDDLLYDGYLDHRPATGDLLAAAPGMALRSLGSRHRTLLAAEADRKTLGSRLALRRAWHWDRIACRARAWRPELIHVHFAWHLAAAIPLARYLDVPIVCTAHHSDIYFEDDWVENLSHPRVAQIITIAQSVNDYMLERCPVLAAKTALIMNPLSPDFLAPMVPPPTRLRIVNVASFKKIKNQAWLVRALALLKARGVDFDCTFVGIGDELEVTREKVALANLGQHVTFAGWQPHAEVLRLMDAASVFVLSSESEGLPTVVTEAIARGRAVVATDLPSTRDASSGGQYASLIALNDDEGLAAAITLAHQEAATKMGRTEAGRRWVEGAFHPDVHWQQLAGVYHRALLSPSCDAKLTR